MFQVTIQVTIVLGFLPPDVCCLGTSGAPCSGGAEGEALAASKVTWAAGSCNVPCLHKTKTIFVIVCGVLTGPHFCCGNTQGNRSRQGCKGFVKQLYLFW